MTFFSFISSDTFYDRDTGGVNEIEADVSNKTTLQRVAPSHKHETSIKRNEEACWRASEWGSAKKSLNPRARSSEGIVGLRARHVRPNLGSGDDWSERVTDGD
ncbi:jg19122 [Pararge aegeria aegeria]|uniref:Jg19122 protein n=1 Tax=Pararge aegeria aegeria TaxID=348720 RepID=A0A8S4QUP7_9NEOP|nr:jg19122 [Pararge aegeria aegeria]